MQEICREAHLFPSSPVFPAALGGVVSTAGQLCGSYTPLLPGTADTGCAHPILPQGPGQAGTENEESSAIFPSRSKTQRHTYRRANTTGEKQPPPPTAPSFAPPPPPPDQPPAAATNPFPGSLTPTKCSLFPLLLLLALVPRPAPLSGAAAAAGCAGDGRRRRLRRVWQKSFSSQAAGAATTCGAVSHAGQEPSCWCWGGRLRLRQTLQEAALCAANPLESPFGGAWAALSLALFFSFASPAVWCRRFPATAAALVSVARPGLAFFPARRQLRFS